MPNVAPDGHKVADKDKYRKCISCVGSLHQ